MGYIQKSQISEKPLLQINPETYAKLVDQNDQFFVFEFTVNVKLENEENKLENYEKILFTLNRSSNDLSDSSYSNYQDSENLNIVNFSLSEANKSVKKRPRYSLKIENRIYSNARLIEKSQTSNLFIERVEVPVSQYVQNKNQTVSYVELFAPKYRENLNSLKQRRDQILRSPGGPGVVSDNYEKYYFNTNNILKRVNKELTDITESLTDESVLKLNSKSLLDNPRYKISYLSSGKSQIYYEFVKYLLTEVPESPQANKMTWYETRDVTKKVTDVDVKVLMRIRKQNKNSNLVLKIELLEKGCHSTVETLYSDLYLANYIESYENVVKPPEINLQQINMTPDLETHGNFLNVVSIVDKDNSDKISSYSMYLKNVHENGAVDPYVKIGTVKKSEKTEFQFKSESKLSILRVVPFLKNNRESHVFSSIAIGPGHKFINNLFIIPQNFGKNEIRIDVFNIPESTILLSLYKRDCTDNPNSSFKFLREVRPTLGSGTVSFSDNKTSLNKVYEYYVVALSIDENNGIELPAYSNYAMIKNLTVSDVQKSLSVRVENKKSSADQEGIKNSFLIKTVVTPEENQRITEYLKNQIGELYQQFLNPSSNSSSPLGDDKGIPNYADLFFHQVVRNNLTTGEREAFDLISDGVFEDKIDTQKIFAVKPLNKRHNYLYQVFTYKKNPIDLFKNFVAKGVDKNAREWFYLPYKWKNPQIKLGKIFADGPDGIPVISPYENFTSESFGVTSVQHVKNSEIYDSDDKKVFTNRVDRNTIKINWTSGNEDETTQYDSFAVLKVVNGVRYILGRTRTNYIYHRLSAEDIGSIYYIVVPIMSEFNLSLPRYSDQITVFPSGLSEKTSVINHDFNSLNRLT